MLYDCVMHLARVNWRPPLAALLIVLIWFWVAWLYLVTKSAFLDDAFIPLRIARHVLVDGTARFFPITENSSLLVSSPLRLLVLLPSTVAAQFIAGAEASLLAARLTFLFSGVFSALFFLPVFRSRMNYWFGGLAFAGLLALSTESALQMEGSLLFWGAYALLIRLQTGPPPGHTPGRIGLMVTLIILARPEFGLVLLPPMAIVIWRSEQGRGLIRFFAPVIAGALGWIFFTVLLGVWPIPATYLSKVVTARMSLFGPGFLSRFPEHVCYYFLLGYRAPTFLLIIGTLGMLFLLAWRRLRRVMMVAVLLGAFALLAFGAGNFLWYFENLFIVLLAVLLCVILERWRPGRDRNYRNAMSLVLIVLFFASSLGRQRALPWDFEEQPSFATSYMNIADHHIGRGLFAFPGQEATLLRMSEIGIVSYFCDNSLWLCDASGLAQVGNLALWRAGPLAGFYPRSLRISAASEYEALLRANKLYAKIHPTHSIAAELNPERGAQLGGYIPELDIRLTRHYYPSR